MKLSQESAQKKLADLGMDDLPITPIAPNPRPVSPDWFTKYKQICHEFMMGLTASVEELSFLNLSQDEFMALLMGRALPSNLSIRFRVPLVWGGTLTESNLFMCHTFSASHNIDRFLIEQSGFDTIWLPNPKKKIYISTHTGNGGDGGNATEDRMSQIAAQIAAGRGMG